jgi:hypothetical protein
MIAIWTGLPGACKTLKMADVCIDTLKRNRKIFNTGRVHTKRLVYLNIKLSREVEEAFGGYIKYWSNPFELTKLKDCDVFIDEIATYFDATQWKEMPMETKRWLQQHRKLGIEIYGTTQDFSQIDIAFRRLTSDLFYLWKACGSRDISATRPNPKFIWGLSIIKTLDPQMYDEKLSKFKSGGLIPSFLFITAEKTEVFDTKQEIVPGEFPPYRHIERVCENPTCKDHYGKPFLKIIHV